MRPVFDWNIGSRVLTLGKRTLLMAVLNITPDSFSDGGLYLDPERAVEQALKLLDEGADILDIGGESTRPAAKAVVTESAELERVIPVIRAVKLKRANATISIDTYKAAVARAAAEAGAEIVNDVSAFRWDPKMSKTVSELKCGAILMHTRGRPDEWRHLPSVGDIVTLVKRELREWTDAATLAGVKRERMMIDPGFGFGKSFEENYPLLRRLEEFHQLRYPIAVGVSRKSFIGRMIARAGTDAPVQERQFGTVAAETAAILKGAQIIRTHDIRASYDAARVADVAA
jgi:dihydropteroate synthase